MEKEAWKDRVLGSLEGIEKVVPRAGLLGDIEQQITDASTADIIPIQQWRFATAAAVVLLIANFWLVKQFITPPSSDSKEIVNSDRNEPALISNYKLYE